MPSNEPRIRPPRVHISYEAEFGPARMELPFIIGVLAGLSGRPAEPLPAMEDREFLEIDVDNFDDRLKAFKPRVAFQVPNTLTGEGNLNVQMTFESMDDFSPPAVARKVAALNKLLQARAELANLLTYIDGKDKAEDLVGKPLNNPELMKSLAPVPNPAAETLAQGAAPPAAAEVSEFDCLLNKELKVRDVQKQTAVRAAVRTLAQQALAARQLVSDDVIRTITAIMAEQDRKLSEQVNLILHHPDFQALEATWRGLAYLVRNTETGIMLRIRVLNISKEELTRQMQVHDGATGDQSPLFRKVCKDEFAMPGGTPFGCLVGDYYFDHSPDDLDTLRAVSKIAAAAHAPFIGSVKPELFGMAGWGELDHPRDRRTIFALPQYHGWNKLREDNDSRYIALTMPRLLARSPYGANTYPVEEFNFEEDVAGSASDKYLWCNSAYAFARNIGRAFKLYGWCVRFRGVESGGLVEDLPVVVLPNQDGCRGLQTPTEIPIDNPLESELCSLGFMPLVHIWNSDSAAFLGAQSLHKPARYGGSAGVEATANAVLTSRLPVILAGSRFAHYLRTMLRDRFGRVPAGEELEAWLQRWLNDYVLPNPEGQPEPMTARAPLRSASVKVSPAPGNPGCYQIEFECIPHYQLESMSAPLRFSFAYRVPD